MSNESEGLVERQANVRKRATREDLRVKMKACSACGLEKRGDAYSICARSDGRVFLASRCKPCEAARKAEILRDNPGMLFKKRESGRLRGWDYANAYTKEKQGASLEAATNKSKEWTGPELELIMRDDLTGAQKAKMLNRTLHAVYSMRRDCKRDPRKQVLAGVERAEL